MVVWLHCELIAGILALLRAGLLPILVMDCYERPLDRDPADEVLTLAFPAPSLVVDVTLTNVIAFLGLFATL